MNNCKITARKPLRGEINAAGAKNAALKLIVADLLIEEDVINLTLLLTQAQGISIIHETVYKNRLGYVDTLNRLGAKIQLSNDCIGSTPCRFKDSNYCHSAIVFRKTKLKSGSLIILDLKAGFAYVLAALSAEGTSILSGVSKVERGYENIIAKFNALGANIEELN